MKLASIVALAAVALSPLLPHARAQDATSPAAKPDAVTLKNHFKPGFVRTYAIRSKMTQIARATVSPNAEAQRAVSKLPVPPPQVTIFDIVEQETCLDRRDDGLFTISYGIESFDLKEMVGEEEAFRCRIRGRDELRKAVGIPRVLRLAALMEEPIRFTISDELAIGEIQLPRALVGPAKKSLVDGYRKNLESRYQAFFPTHPVRPGDAWTSDLPSGERFYSAAAVVPASQMKCNVRFAERKRYRGHDCALLEVDISLAMKKGTVVAKTAYQSTVADHMQGHSRIHFAIDTGTPLKEETRIKLFTRRVIGFLHTPIIIQQDIDAEWQSTKPVSSAPKSDEAGQ